MTTMTNEMAIGRVLYQVEALPEREGPYKPAYRLTGPRGAQYLAVRNLHNPEMLFLVNERRFGATTACEWVREVEPGVLVVVR